MARDHRKLRVFADAHQLTLAMYRETRGFPRDEWFALRQQMRRAAVSIPSNIVEGNARRTTREYVHFLNVARGSAAEVSYLVDLASELGYLSGASFKDLNERCQTVCRTLESLLQRMEQLLVEEKNRPASSRNDQRPKARDERPKTRD